jgi:spoIIIJ-associated protein
VTGFFSKLFGGGKKKTGPAESENLIKETIQGIIERANFDLGFSLTHTEENDEAVVIVNFDGPDEALLKEREGQLIDAFQLLIKRILQHHFPEDRTNIVVDCNGFREESNQALVDLAEKLKGIALEKGKSVYFRALPPKDRKIIHQYLAGDQRVKSRSIGDGLYKKIKIYPVKGHRPDVEDESAAD